MPHGDSGTPTLQSLQGQKLPPHNMDLITDDELYGLDVSALSEQMQILSFSQNYHNVLADQYHE